MLMLNKTTIIKYLIDKCIQIQPMLMLNHTVLRQILRRANNSNTTYVNVKPCISAREALGFAIQIQPMLMLNCTSIAIGVNQLMKYSNTTYVNVKHLASIPRLASCAKEFKYNLC